jgi:hypothetical protein
VKRLKGSARTVRRRAPTENGYELSKEMISARRDFLAWSFFRKAKRMDSTPWFS